MSKKISLIIILALALILVMVIPSNRVYALNKEVTSVNTAVENGKITVSGSVQDGMLAVAVQVFDEDDNLITIETGAIDSSNNYKVEIDVANGKYVVKVADYDGGQVVSKEVIVSDSTQEDTISNSTNEGTTDSENVANEAAEKNEVKTSTTPKTGDNIMMFIAIFILAVISFGIIKFNKSNAKIKRRKH